MIQIGSNKWSMEEVLTKARQLSLDNPKQVFEIHEDVGMKYIVVGDTGAEGRATFCYRVRNAVVEAARDYS